MRIIQSVLTFRYPRWVLMIVDLVLINGFFSLLREIEFKVLILPSERSILIFSLLILLFGRLIGIYDPLTRFFNFYEFKRLLILIFSFSFVPFFFEEYFYFEFWFFFFSSLSGILVSYRLLIKQLNSNLDQSFAKPAFIYGTSEQAVFLKRSFFNSPHFTILGFIDDNEALKGRKIDGVYVFSRDNTLDKYIKKHKISKIIFTPEVNVEKDKRLVEYFKDRHFQIYSIPSTNKILEGKFSISQLKKIKIEDVLSRTELDIDSKSNSEFYQNKTILISGGAGSIGSEILRQILIFNPKKVVAFDINETALYYLSKELEDYPNVEFVLLNILDLEDVRKLFLNNTFDFVFHAAAFKHVSIVEGSPITALKNNILGTSNLAELSVSFKVDKFVLVSTDKAVNPTNVMGASKRFCEMLVNFIGTRNGNKTKFITTRFGNVLGSNGSVLPIFERQIADGGPVTLTHSGITRYFMTIPEASKLVLESCRIGLNNRIYIFDMGKPVKIIELAENMILLSGYRPYEDIEIKIVGLRPGEKLFEELLLETEILEPSPNKHLFIAKKDILTRGQLFKVTRLLKILRKSNVNDLEVIRLMKKIIPEYKSKNSPFESLD